MNIFSIKLPSFKGVAFSKYWPDFYKEIKVIPEKDPMEPFMSVSDDILTLRTGYHTRRNVSILPVMIVFTIASFFRILDNPLHYNYNHMRGYASDMVRYYQKEVANFTNYQNKAIKEENTQKIERYGEIIKDDLKEIDGLMIYLRKEGTVNIFTHIEALIFFDDDRLDSFIYSSLSAVMIISVTAILWFLFLIRPRDAKIYFDRRRQIIYTWRSGRVGAADFDKVGLMTCSAGLQFVLLFEDKKGVGYTPVATTAINIGKLFGHVSKDYIYTLGQILAFMEHGKEAIITGDSFQRRTERFFLRKQKKPNDLNPRIDAALNEGNDLIERYENHKIKQFQDF